MERREPGAYAGEQLLFVELGERRSSVACLHRKVEGEVVGGQGSGPLDGDRRDQHAEDHPGGAESHGTVGGVARDQSDRSEESGPRRDVGDQQGGERKRIESIRRASDIIMFGEGNQAFTDGGSWLWYDDWELESGGPSGFAYQPTTPAATDPDRPIPIDHNVDSDGATQYTGTGVRYRHGAGDPGPNTAGIAVMSYTDGHAEALGAGAILQKNVALTY